MKNNYGVEISGEEGEDFYLTGEVQSGQMA